MSAASSKQEYFIKLQNYLDSYYKAILFNCDNVSSKQFQDIRRAIRKDSVILMGKNTLIKRCLHIYLDDHGAAAKRWEGLHEFLVGNIGIVFTKSDLIDVRTEILNFKVGAPARVGALLPVMLRCPQETLVWILQQRLSSKHSTFQLKSTRALWRS